MTCTDFSKPLQTWPEKKKKNSSQIYSMFIKSSLGCIFVDQPVLDSRLMMYRTSDQLQYVSVCQITNYNSYYVYIV